MRAKPKLNKKSFPKKAGYLLLATLCVSVIFALLSLRFYPKLFVRGKLTPTTSGELKYFSVDELKKYDGSDPAFPIYMGYETKVYDVTAGKNFYQKGATYNYLVGRDSTKELNEVGVGEIIIRKYPVIGILK